MKISLHTLSITAATAFLAVIFIAGVRERIVNIPRWFANPPASFELIRQQAPAAQRFWIPLQIVFLIALIFAFGTNWKHKDVRSMLLLGTAGFAAVIALTAVYFVKDVMDFSRMPIDSPATPELLKRARTWYHTTIIRNVLQGAALVCFVIATLRSFKS